MGDQGPTWVGLMGSAPDFPTETESMELGRLRAAAGQVDALARRYDVLQNMEVRADRVVRDLRCLAASIRGEVER